MLPILEKDIYFRKFRRLWGDVLFARGEIKNIVHNQSNLNKSIITIIIQGNNREIVHMRLDEIEWYQ